MARDKQIGLKFEKEDVERWDAFAGQHGYTRTTLIETAVERLIDQAQKQAPGKERRSPKIATKSFPPGVEITAEDLKELDREAQRSPDERVEAKAAHQARAGIRRAYVCTNKECIPPHRIFLDAEAPDETPKCPEHGRTMELQQNRPYFGQSTL